MTAEVIIKGDRAGTSAGLRQPPEPEQGELRRTPVEIEGPYFRLGAPERSNLLEPGDKAELVLKGRVINEKGKPIPDAVVALWMSDQAGNYDMVGYKYHGFQRTDAEGPVTSSPASSRAATSRAAPPTCTSRSRATASRSRRSYI